jgi:ATP-dependent Clp protease ATP-binding subunit ClpA
MFERFTDRARAVIVASGDVARELRSPAVRRHHVLIALIDAASDGSDVVATVFNDAGVDAADLRAKLAASVLATETQTDPTANKLPLTAEARMTIEVALREALSMGHNYIGREHLLLAILRTAEGPLADVLNATKLTHDQARAVVSEKSPPTPGWSRRQLRREVRESMRGGPRAFRLGRRTTDGVQAVLRKAFERAKDRDTTTGDLLVALLDTPGSHFHAALAGVTLPDAASVTAQVDKLVADDAPDGLENALRIHDDTGGVTFRDKRIADAVKNLVGEGGVTPERLNEILRRLQG